MISFGSANNKYSIYLLITPCQHYYYYQYCSLARGYNSFLLLFGEGISVVFLNPYFWEGAFLFFDFFDFHFYFFVVFFFSWSEIDEIDDG